MLHRETPLVLIANVSLHDRRNVELALKETGLTTSAVDDAGDAARELAANGGAGVLVIDSGLLEARHDDQWRRLLMSHPMLAAVVLSWIPGSKGSRRTDPLTYVVHVADDEALRAAVSDLAGGLESTRSLTACPASVSADES